VIRARRYRCRCCAASLSVLPSEALPRRHYAATAIALALAIYGVGHESHAAVRAQVSSDGTVGVAAERRWCTLSRWIDAVAQRSLFPAVPVMAGQLPRRTIAERAAMAIGAHAPPSLAPGAPELRAFVGAAQMS
jgi:hypothetical protein